MSNLTSFFGEWHVLVLNSSIIGLVLLAMPIVMSTLLRRSSAALRHRIWSLAFCGLICTPALIFFLPQLQLPHQAQPVVQVEETNSLLVEESELASERIADRFALEPVSSAKMESDEGTPITVMRRKRSAEQDSRASSLGKDSVFDSFSWQKQIETAWLCGVLLLLTRTLSASYQKCRLLKEANEISDGGLCQQLTAMRQKLGVVRQIRVFVSAEDVTPMTWGLLRPVILIPESFRSWTTQRRQVVLLHELTHIKRFDYFFQLVATAASVLFWFNPLVWFGLYRLRTECERACDDAVVHAGERASDYAKELVEIAAAHAHYPTSLAIAMARKSQLEDRIVSMFDRARSHGPLSRSCEVGLVTAMFFFVCLTVVVRPVRGFDVDRTTAAEESEFAESERKATDSLGDPLPIGSRLRLGSQRFSHPTIACELALSPDEKTLVTAGYETMIVWDAETGKERWRANLRELGFRVPAASYGVRAIAFKGDNSVFYTPGSPNEFNVWNTQTGELKTVKSENLINRFLPRRGLRSQARSIDVTRDGKRIALGSAQGLTVCDENCKTQFVVKNKIPVKPMQFGRDRLEFGGHYTFARFSPDEKVLAMVTFESPKEIRILDAKTAKELKRITLTDKMVRFDFSPDSRQIVTTERDNAVRLYDVATAKSIWEHTVKLTHPLENYTSAVDFSPSGTAIAIGATDDRLYLLDAATGDEVARLEGHQWYPWAVQFTADSERLYSVGWDGVIRRWDLTTMRQLTDQT